MREDLLHNSFRQAVYVKVAGASEPSGYSWTLPAWRRVAGGIVAYAGVDIAGPVAAHAGLVQGDAATDVTAPSVDIATGGSMLVHLGVANSESTISPPSFGPMAATCPPPRAHRPLALLHAALNMSLIAAPVP